MKNLLSAKKLSITAAALIGVLAFLYPIPGTGAYRNICFLLILVLIIATAILGAREGESGWRDLAIPWRNSIGAIFLTLSGWMLVRVLLAENPLVRAAEWAEEWLIGGALLCFITFVVTNQVLRNRGSVSVITIVFISLMCHVVWTLAYQIQLGLTGAQWLGLTPFAARDFASTIVGYAFALSFADRFSRSVKAPSLITIPDRLSKVCFALCLLLIVTLNTRNGVLTVLAVTFFLFTAALLNSNWKLSDLTNNLFAHRVIVFSVLLVLASIVVDSRWLHFFDTLGLTLDNQATIEVSELSGARGVESSLALRLNYFRLGMTALIDYPLGVGYARDAFGELMSRQGAGEQLVSSHSGLLDFTLANGLPALALWIFLSVMIVKGSLELAKNGNMSAFFLTSIWSTFFIRTLLDGHFSGWRLKLFAIIIGCLTAAILSRSQGNTPNNSIGYSPN